MQNNQKRTYKIIGQRVRKIREEKKLTKKYMANAIGIAPATYARVEKGEARLSLDIIKGIVLALNIKSGDIVPF